eukprot:366428-Chlamydomonas_euryale.AAC.5
MQMRLLLDPLLGVSCKHACWGSHANAPASRFAAGGLMQTRLLDRGRHVVVQTRQQLSRGGRHAVARDKHRRHAQRLPQADLHGTARCGGVKHWCGWKGGRWCGPHAGQLGSVERPQVTSYSWPGVERSHARLTHLLPVQLAPNLEDVGRHGGVIQRVVEQVLGVERVKHECAGRAGAAYTSGVWKHVAAC